jgi:hypothetical protein
VETLKILFPMFVILIIIFWGLTKSIITGGAKNFLLGIVLLIFICSGTTLGLRVGNGIDDIQNSGAYTSWVLLNSQVKFTEIVDISRESIWARTMEGNLYVYNNAQWKETISVPSNAHENDVSLTMKKGKTCPDIQDYPKKFPGEVVECAIVSWLDPGGGESFYYALIKDGTLWWWQRKRSASDMLPPPGMGIGLLVGFLLGILAGILFLRILQKKYKISLTWFGKL